MKKIFLFSMCALVCLGGLTSCGDKDDDTTTALTAITVTPPSVSVTINGTVQLTATPVPSDAAYDKFTWTSSNEQVAAVSSGGMVTGRSAGEAIVTVSSGSISTTVAVTVSAEVIALTGIKVNRSTVVKSVDDTAKVVATPDPANATDVTFAWSSADENIATVTQDGIITIKDVGTTTITVSANGKSATVAVEGVIKGLAIKDPDGNTTSGTYSRGETVRLTAVIDPENTGILAEWTTNNSQLVSIEYTGNVAVVTIESDMGSATVTATVGDFIANYVISTSSPLEDAKAYWKFDDPSNWGKSEIEGAGDLDINMDLVTYQQGLYNGDGAIRGNWETSLDENQDTPNVTWINTMPGQYGDENKLIRNFTVMMDLKVLYQDKDPGNGTLRNVWCPLIWNGVGFSAMGAITHIAWRHYEDERGLVVALNTRWGTWIPLTGTYDPATITANEPWLRIVFSYEYNENAGPGEGPFRLYSYANGHPAVENSTYLYPSDEVVNTELEQGKEVYFMTRRKGDKPFKGQYDLTTLALWDRVLTPEEVATLGAIGN